MLYHISETPLSIGTVLECRFGLDPAHKAFYGVLRDAFQAGSDALQALVRGDDEWRIHLKEYVFELVRAARYSARPSRLGGCVYVMDCLEGVTEYRKTYRGTSYVFSCEAEGSDHFRGDYLLVASADPRAPIEDQLRLLTQNANTYWQGAPPSIATSELLVTGKVTVVGQLP